MVVQAIIFILCMILAASIGYYIGIDVMRDEIMWRMDLADADDIEEDEWYGNDGDIVFEESE